METKYEIGGTLTDANGVAHEIEDIRPQINGHAGGWRIVFIKLPDEEGGGEWVDPRHYIYSPPVRLVPMTRELQVKLDVLEYIWESQHAHGKDKYLSEFVLAYRAAKGAAK